MINLTMKSKKTKFFHGKTQNITIGKLKDEMSNHEKTLQLLLQHYFSKRLEMVQMSIKRGLVK